MKIFISGSISIKQLPQIATEKIDSIMKNKYTILIGDAKGVDSIVQNYLIKKNYNDVIIYYSGNRVRNNLGQWETKKIDGENGEKGRALHTLKDIEMSNDANYALMIWDGKSRGTFNNIITMKSLNKKFYVVINDKIITDEEFESLLAIDISKSNNLPLSTIKGYD